MFSLPTHLVKHPSGRGSAWHTVNSSLASSKSCSLLLWLHRYLTLLNIISFEQKTCDNNVSTSSPGPAEQPGPGPSGSLLLSSHLLLPHT